MDERKNFGKYEILEELGRGGFGTVYKAQDKVLGRLVAIKVLHPALVVEPSFIERFRQEARIAASLDHPNLVPVHDFSEAEGRYYIAMGFMKGGSLKDLLKKDGPIRKAHSLEIIQQLGAGLSYAHSRNVIHRDLKPGNILFDERGIARVSDMGFAKLLHSENSTSMSSSGGLVGTPAYMAPEIWRGKGANAATDVYSLACILVEMLTAEPLFDGESTPEVMFKHFESLQLPEDLPQYWKPVIEQALENRTEERIGNVSQFITLLHSADKTFAQTLKGAWQNQFQSSDQSELELEPGEGKRLDSWKMEKSQAFQESEIKEQELVTGIDKGGETDEQEILKLYAPKQVRFIISVVLFVLALLAQFIFGVMGVLMPWLWIMAFVLLALGVVLRGRVGDQSELELEPGVGKRLDSWKMEKSLAFQKSEIKEQEPVTGIDKGGETDEQKILKLYAPKQIRFIISVILFVLALLAQFIFGVMGVLMPWLWIMAFVLLALGVVLRGRVGDQSELELEPGVGKSIDRRK